LSLGKGATLTVAAKHNSCTLQATLSTQGVIQRLPNAPLALATLANSMAIKMPTNLPITIPFPVVFVTGSTIPALSIARLFPVSRHAQTATVWRLFVAL
ncbi:hypothetical protein, partial [Alcanivorax sp. HI0083]|uniref:hypothetical protein n=1 Tax=Alcanivorax sp. HI0083 TaxID=1822258 RepID=UPI001E4B516C